MKGQHSGGAHVDHLADALSGLELCSGTNPTKRAHEIATPASQARPRARPRQADNKENANNDADSITPSRLTCFKQLRDELTCAVCLDICVRPCTTPCGHNYCRTCLRRNLELNRPCPKCRASLPPGFALNINTTLWNTIQHLFPTEAGEKPMTPPQPPPQPVIERHQPGISAYGNPAAAPFRPPRFQPSGEPALPLFTGQSSSRANAAAAMHMAGSGMGLASRSGRSVSGPRPQRQLPGSFYNHAAAPPGEGAVTTQAPGAAYVPSLAELGVRAAREGPRARRERRRSRSAERWDGAPLLVAATAADGGVQAMRSGPSGTAAQPQPQSLLMELLGDGPSGSASATANGTEAPLNAGSSLSLNPFMRSLRPILTRPPVAPSSAITGIASGSQSRHQFNGKQDADAAPGRLGEVRGASFTASQRALLGSRDYVNGAMPGRTASTLGDASAGVNAAGPTSSGLSAAASSSSSYLCDGSMARSSSTDSSSSGALGDVSALDLTAEEQPPRLRVTSSGGSNGAVASGRRVMATADISEDQAGLGVRVAQGCRSDTRDQGTTRLPSAHLTVGTAIAAPVVMAAMAPRALTLQIGSGLGAGAGTRLVGDDDGDDEITLEGLDILSPAGPTPELRIANGSPDASPCTGGARRADASSPTWEQLDVIMARGLQSVDVSPASLPRLRLPARQSLFVAAAPAQPNGAVNAASHRGGSTNMASDFTAAENGNRDMDGSPAGSLDPDLPSNYDGEDPAAADTFFSSPFFDRTMLWDSLRDREDENEHGSEASFSPSWAVGGANQLQAFNDASELLEPEAGGNEAAGLALPTSAARRHSARVRGGLTRLVLAQEAAQPGIASGSVRTALPGPVPQPLDGGGLQAGDRGCPIEICSDSDDEELLSTASGMVGRQPVPARQPCRRVVAGLRRPQRA